MKQNCRQLLRNGEIISSAGAMDIRKHCMYRNENIPQIQECVIQSDKKVGRRSKTQIRLLMLPERVAPLLMTATGNTCNSGDCVSLRFFDLVVQSQKLELTKQHS